MKPRILVVDDDQYIREFFTDLFSMHNVVTVLSGQEALDLIEKQSFNVVFLDLKLSSSVDGIDVFRKIKSISGTRVIVMTGYPIDENLALELEKADAFIEKPFDLIELETLLNSMVN